MNANISVHDVYCVDIHTYKDKGWEQAVPDDYVAIRIQGKGGDVTIHLDSDAAKKLLESLLKMGLT